MLTPALALLTLLAGTAAAVVDATGRPGRGALKMTAASGYLAFALALGAPGTPYGRFVLLALLLSWAGDFFLLGDSRRSFVTGLAAFLLAHVAYAVAFTIAGVGASAMVGAAGMVVVGVVVLRWLLAAGLPARMRIPVAAYLLAIAAMVALAVGTGSPTLTTGAIAFAASDILVARNRFVAPSPANRLVGLPLYFVAQLLIASTV
ncbi:MAG: lysoplasmalogenase [Gemmatimonadota bacterium]